jgi:hypothetical protein
LGSKHFALRTIGFSKDTLRRRLQPELSIARYKQDHVRI